MSTIRSQGTKRKNQYAPVLCHAETWINCPIQHQTGHHFAAFAFSHDTSSFVVLQDLLFNERNDGCQCRCLESLADQSSKQKNKNKRKQKGSSELVCDPRTASAKPSLVMDLESVQGIATTAAATSATTPAHEKLDAAGCQALRTRTLQRSAGLAAQAVSNTCCWWMGGGIKLLENPSGSSRKGAC